MEALDLGKALLVVVNAGLMDDHQQELARAMEEQVRSWTVKILPMEFIAYTTFLGGGGPDISRVIWQPLNRAIC